MPQAQLLLPAVLIALIVVTIIGCVWVMKRRRAKGPGTCGKCGYNVTGLTTFTCPECGSDLREVGIVQGGPGGRPSRASMALALQLGLWTLLYAALYGFLGAHSYPSTPAALAARKIEYGLLDAYWWPYEGRSAHSVVLTPSSGGYRSLTVTERRHAEFKGWRKAPVVNWTGNTPSAGLDEFTITLEIEPADDPSAPKITPAPLKIDAKNPASLAWSYDDPQTPGKTFSGQSPAAPLSAEVIHGWMINNGVTVPSYRVRDEADALLDMITDTIKPQAYAGPLSTTGRLEAIAAAHRTSPRYFPAGYPFTATRGIAQDRYGPGWSIYWLSIPFGLGVYTYGANWIWARHRKVVRKKRREAAAAEMTNSVLLGKNQQSRTLTILFTDLKDYTSKTASASRESLLAMLKANQAVVEASVRKNRGKIMKTIGDAYLATFESATDAVLAGLQIQQAAVEHNRDAPAATQLEYRVAVCTGEVLFTGGDVFGTPVNMAARVQAVAEPGQVYFTESTLHAINTPDVAHEEVGSRELKGMPNPVKLYKAMQPGEPGAG